MIRVERRLKIGTARRLRQRLAQLRPVALCLAGGTDDEIIHALEASAQLLGGVSTCLVQALVGELLLGHRDRPVHLTIGVRFRAKGVLESHAWIERGGRVIVGGAECDQFVQLITWESL